MDKALSENAIQKKKRDRIIYITLFCLAFLLILLSLRILIKPSIKRSGIQTATVEIGNIEASITASGTVLPEFEEVIISPVQSRILHIYHNIGDRVNKGDSILSLDKKSIESSFEKLQDELNMKWNTINQLKLKLEGNLIDLRTQYEIKKLQVENMKAELEEEKYINKIGGGTKEKIEQAELNLKISLLELEQIKQSIMNQEKAMQADLLSQNFEISIQQKNVSDLRDKLNQSTIIADKEGVITWIDDQIGKNINTGDELVKIANLESYEVAGSISDRYADQLNTGRQVMVRLNEGTDVRGEIVSISPSVSGNTVQFKINLKIKNHPLLRPNLKVDVFVITSFKNHVAIIKNGLFYKGGVKQKVFIMQGNELIGKQVAFGESNFDCVEVASGLVKGETVVISDMSDYERYTRLRVK
jgi:HlyD family secretion protein